MLSSDDHPVSPEEIELQEAQEGGSSSEYESSSNTNNRYDYEISKEISETQKSPKRLGTMAFRSKESKLAEEEKLKKKKEEENKRLTAEIKKK